MNCSTDWIEWRLGRGGLVVLLAILVAACMTTREVGAPGLPQEEGEASYYAGKFAGKPTASGEIFNPEAITAAHRTLPFGTRVRVTRIDVPEEPSVTVRINDRGPFKRGRIIDLSKAAARRLQMVQAGVAEVRLEVVSYPDGVDTEASRRKAKTW